ncbi:MAG: hypothetical protein WCY58_08105 [Mariniphaga sp.]|nr:hypothetical protein [Mariniphaga sp.]MDD4226102.1 hypothetical protein [Mariniphaga sp.]MDD4424413.1 hypothetical protein [Mariniphaga sp.]
MDDLIVIFLTLVFIIGGLFGQLKKKQAESVKKINPPSSSGDLWELPAEDWAEPTDRYEKSGFKTTRPEPKERTLFHPKKEGERITISKTQIGSLAKEKATRESNIQFSLREAVIYSEILNRKYIE